MTLPRSDQSDSVDEVLQQAHANWDLDALAKAAGLKPEDIVDAETLKRYREKKRAQPARFAEWDESKHPREEDGKFAPEEGGGKPATATAEAETEVLDTAPRTSWGADWFERMHRTVTNPSAAPVDDLLEALSHYQDIYARADKAGNLQLRRETSGILDKLQFAFNDHVMRERKRKEAEKKRDPDPEPPPKPEPPPPPPPPPKVENKPAPVDRAEDGTVKIPPAWEKEIAGFRNYEQARTFAKDRLGIIYSSSAKNAAFHRRTMTALARVHQMGLEMPGKVNAESFGFRRMRGSRRTPGMYSPTFSDTIWLNPNADGWRKEGELAKMSQRCKDKLWWSTGSPEHVIVHEMGHMMHHRTSAKDFLQCMIPGATWSQRALMSQVAREVTHEDLSQYGFTDKAEFVAEAYAKAKISGKPLPANVLKWYKQFGGPPL